jgi:hypothetical protein
MMTYDLEQEAWANVSNSRIFGNEKPTQEKEE